MEGTGGAVLLQQVKNVGGGQMVEGFATKKKFFVLNAELELDKNECDMIRWFGAGDNVCCRVLIQKVKVQLINVDEARFPTDEE